MPVRPTTWWAPLLTFALLAPAARAGEPPAIDYNRQIRPILSNRCYACHGPDAGLPSGITGSS